MEENVPNVAESVTSNITSNVTPNHEFYDDIAGLHILLDDIYDECKEWGWDGYDAYPISESALIYSHTFIELIPDNIPMPIISCEPSGDITFEWYKKNDRTLIISVDNCGMISYIWCMGKTIESGDVMVEGGEFPEKLIEMIKVIYDAQ